MSIQVKLNLNHKDISCDFLSYELFVFFQSYIQGLGILMYVPRHKHMLTHTQVCKKYLNWRIRQQDI